MAYQPDNEGFTDVYQLETTDTNQAGLGGVLNRPLKELASRDTYLLDALKLVECRRKHLGTVETTLTASEQSILEETFAAASLVRRYVATFRMGITPTGSPNAGVQASIKEGVVGNAPDWNHFSQAGSSAFFISGVVSGEIPASAALTIRLQAKLLDAGDTYVVDEESSRFEVMTFPVIPSS